MTVSTPRAPDGSLSSSPAAFRNALATDLRDASLDRWRRATPELTIPERIAEHAQLVGALWERGWTRYGWPEAVGGLGGDAVHRAVFYDELAIAGLPIPDTHLMLETMAPPLVHFAPELAAELLPAYLRGDEWWGQGFSEPEAGSDLAALLCRARRDGDDYVVSGAKLWTSHGATARRLMCLVRTGTPESRHRGLTMIMIDTSAPGVSARPVALAGGDEELAEEFFDDVRVPATHLVGEEGKGWAVAMYLLQFERSMWAWQSSVRQLAHLRHLLSEVRGRRLPDGATRRIGEIYADVVALRSRSSETLRRLASGQAIGPEASVDKVLLARAETGVLDLARDLWGDAFLWGSSAVDNRWRGDWWYSRAATVMGGSSEVQRTILADHVLGLPKEGGA